MNELKPCPFCGGEATLLHGQTENQYSYVRCGKCFSKTAEYYIATTHSCDDKAIEAWNRRAGDGK